MSERTLRGPRWRVGLLMRSEGKKCDCLALHGSGIDRWGSGGWNVRTDKRQGGGRERRKGVRDGGCARRGESNKDGVLNGRQVGSQ